MKFENLSGIEIERTMGFNNLTLASVQKLGINRFKSKQNKKVNNMKDLLKAGQVLGRSEMKKIMAGSGEGWRRCYCNGAGTACCSPDIDDDQCCYAAHGTSSSMCNIAGSCGP